MLVNVDTNADTQKSSQKCDAFVAFLTGRNQLLLQKYKEKNEQIKLVNFDVSKRRLTSVAP